MRQTWKYYSLSSAVSDAQFLDLLVVHYFLMSFPICLFALILPKVWARSIPFCR